MNNALVHHKNMMKGLEGLEPRMQYFSYWSGVKKDHKAIIFYSIEKSVEKEKSKQSKEIKNK